MSETVFERGPLVSLENSVGFLTTVLIILLNLSTELNNFTSLNVFFKGGQGPPPAKEIQSSYRLYGGV